jgi:hypothetical protein
MSTSRTIPMRKLKKGFQGEICKVKRRNGDEQPLLIFNCSNGNASDFSSYDYIILGEADIKDEGTKRIAEQCKLGLKYPTERVPINEEIWRRIGIEFGYRFRQMKKVNATV